MMCATIVVPIILLAHADDKTIGRWSNIGQALTPVGVLFSGLAFVGIALTLAYQRRELHNQGEEIDITREEQQRGSEVALRQLHNDLIKMAIFDEELRDVWPQISPGVDENRKDHYCNLILNLQKVAYETKTIELAELRGALEYLLASPDVYKFWEKARSARIKVTGSDATEDFFTQEVDAAFTKVPRPARASPRHSRRDFGYLQERAIHILARVRGKF